MAQSESNQVKRELKTRHLSMIALGGSIGTGLFVASGSAIATAGPGGAIAAYVGIGLMVFFLMTSLGEMATYVPVSGSFSEYASRFVDPAFGFALGWNYWFNWAITVAVDVSTTAIVMHFWLPDVPGWLISMGFLALIFVINIISVKSFGETEYWLSLVKIVTVLVFLVVGLLTIVGQDLQAVQNFAWGRLLVSYMSIPLFIVLFVWYKVKHRTKMIPLDQVDLSAHRDHRN